MRNPAQIAVVIVGVLVFSCVLVVCVVGAALYAWALQDAPSGMNPITAISLRVNLARNEDTLTQPAGDDPAFREFVINPGELAGTIAQNLFDADLITDADLFVDYVRFYGLDSQLQSGTYFLQQTQSIEEIAEALTDAQSAAVRFTMIAGWRLEEVAETAVDGNPYLDFNGVQFFNTVGPGAPVPLAFAQRYGIPSMMVNSQPPSLEGFLFPKSGGYLLKPGITAEELRDEMLAEFTANFTDDMITLAEARGLTPYQVIILASIVQREAVEISEAPLIASVYLNRLAINMRLDADPTVQYAIGYRDGRWWPRLSGTPDYYATSGVQPDADYNTYLKRDGMTVEELLPPGPIASPGMAAINAVLQPASTEYLYFRSCDGETHKFYVDQQSHAAEDCEE